MSDRHDLVTEMGSLKNSVDELRNENDVLNSTIINSKSQINTLEFTLSKEMSRAEELSSIITQQKNVYEKEMLVLKETLVCFNNFLINH